MRTTLSLPAHYSCEERKMSFVCRVCLGQERLHTLENDLLVDVYDKLSNTKFNSEDARPRALCCFCHDKLLTCHNFYEMTLVSEELFSQLLDKGLEATHENITDLNHAVKQHMPVTNKQIINDNTTNENTEVIIKWETISEKEEKTGSQLVQSEFVSGALVENEPITVKEELNTEVQLVQPEIQYVRPEVQLMKPDVQLVQPEQQEDKLVKNQSVSSADCTKSQLSLVKSINEKSVLVIKTNGEKRFGCTICYKQFTKKSGVVRHMVIHTGEKPYSCDVCDKRFNRKSILVEHKNIHTGIKLFTCNVCNKQFKNKVHAQFGAAVAAIQDALANEVSIPTSNGERVPIRAAVIAFSERCISNNNEGGNTANAGRCASTINPLECDEYSRGVVEKVDFIPLIPEPETLSVSAAKCDYTGVELIVGGEVATQGEFPHMAAIGWANFEGGYSFFCGGSLISPRFVLSAGHCLRFRDTSVQDPTPVTVRLGDQNIDPTVRDGADPTDVPIRRSYRHPDYKPPQTYNDIALFELQTDVQFNSGVRPACLWTRPDFGVHSKAIATGWGVTDSDPRSRKTSKELQKVSLSLLENEYCDDLLFDIRNRNWRGFEPSQMCAGELRGGKDTCQGDSGSPLQVASRENQCIFYVMGITSFGRRCAESGKPAVYTRVAAYLDWIEQTVWPGE